jgi:hypothetical protein
LAFAREARGLDLALGATFAKAARHQDGVKAFEIRRRVLGLEDLGIDPFGLHLHPVRHAAMGQRLGDRLVGVPSWVYLPTMATRTSPSALLMRSATSPTGKIGAGAGLIPKASSTAWSSPSR